MDGSNQGQISNCCFQNCEGKPLRTIKQQAASQQPSLLSQLTNTILGSETESGTLDGTILSRTLSLHSNESFCEDAVMFDIPDALSGELEAFSEEEGKERRQSTSSVALSLVFDDVEMDSYDSSSTQANFKKPDLTCEYGSLASASLLEEFVGGRRLQRQLSEPIAVPNQQYGILRITRDDQKPVFVPPHELVKTDAKDVAETGGLRLRGRAQQAHRNVVMQQTGFFEGNVLLANGGSELKTIL